MSDISGSASVQITPDVSGFADQLAAMLGPAIDDAISLMSSGGKAMGEAISNGLAPGLDQAASVVESATSQISDSFASGLGGGIEAAAETIGSAAEGIAGEIESSIGGSVSAAAGEVAAGSQGIAASVRDSVGPAAAETTAAGREEFSRFSADAKAAGETVKTDVGGSINSLTETIKGVAIGSLIADSIQAGIATAVSAVEGLVTALPDIGEAFHRSFQVIRVGTGETGVALDGMKESFRDVFAQTPASGDQVAAALTLVSQRLGLTGDSAEATSLSMIKLARITGADVNAVVDKATAVFNNFGVSAENQTGQLDKFLRISQKTGVNVDDLLGSMQSSGLAFKAAGFDIDETAAIIGNLSKVGLDASAVQLAFAKATAKSAETGIPARKAIDDLFNAIKNAPSDMAATNLAVENFGTRAGPRLAELIKDGKLSYEDLVKTVQGGGDTINAAAKDTATWHGALEILGHQIQEVVEPAATAVFEGINTGIRAVSPVIASFVGLIGDNLTPVFQGMVGALTPVWQLMDRVRVAFAFAVAALNNGMGVFEAIGVFFGVLTNNRDVATAVSDGLNRLGDAIGKIWDALQPVRDAIAQVFDTIRTAISDFIAANPEAAFAGLTAAVGSILMPVLFGLVGILTTVTGLLWSLISTVLAAVAPALATAAAIGVLVAAAVYAYQHFQPFHDAVDAVAKIIVEDFLAALTAASDFVNNTVIPWIDNLISLLPSLWSAISSGDTQGIGEILDNILGNTGELVAPFKDAAQIVITSVTAIRDIILEWWTVIQVNILPALQRLWDTLGGGQGILQWLIDHWYLLAAGIAFLVAGPIALLIGGLIALYVKFQPIRDIVAAVAEQIAVFVKALVGVAGPVIGGVIDMISGLVQILQGLFTLDFSKVGEGIATFAQATLTVMAKLFGDLPTIIVNALQGILDAILGQLSKIPILGNLFDGIKTIVGGLADILRGVFEILQGIFTLDFDKIKSGLAGALAGIKDALAGFFGGIGGFLRDLLVTGLPLIWDGIKAAAPALLEALGTLLSNIPGWLLTALQALGTVAFNALSALISNLPGWLLTALQALGSVLVTGLTAAWDWVVANGPGVLANIGTWIAGLPGMILGWLGNLGTVLLNWVGSAVSYLVTNAATIMGTLAGWVARIPYMLALALIDGVQFLANWIGSAIQWVVDNGPGILAGILSWIEELPGKLIDAAAALRGMLFDWAKGAFQWVVDNGPGILAAILGWVGGIPGAFITGLATLGGLLVDWIRAAFAWLVEHGEEAISATLDFFRGIPGKIVSAIGDLGRALVEKGGDLVRGLWEGFKSALGAILDGLGAIAKPFVDAFKSAFGIASPSKLMIPVGESIGQGILAGMTNVLGNIGSTVQAAAKDAATAVNPEDWANQVETQLGFQKNGTNVIISMMEAIKRYGLEAISGTGDIAGTEAVIAGSAAAKRVVDYYKKLALQQGIPVPFAAGGIVTGPTNALIGEAGWEAVVPLSNPAQGAAVARAAGIPAMLGAGAGTVVNNVMNIEVVVQATPDTTVEHAAAVGDAAGNAAAEAVQRRLAIRANILAAS